MSRIAIVMPVFNAATALRAALDSAMRQTVGDFEAVVVDDGSTDDTPALLEEAARHDGRIRVIRQDHQGIVAALNRGIEASTGELIARMDADDLCDPRRLELQSSHLSAHPETGLVSCRVDFGGDRAAAAGYARYVDWTNSLLVHEQIALNRFRESPLAHPSVMFRRELVARYGGYRDGDFPEDYELWLRWLDAGVRMGKCPETLLTWNDPPGRLSRAHDRYSPGNFWRIKAQYLARWLAANNPHHPRVIAVGSGRVTRRRVDRLMERGVEIVAYADLDPAKVGRVHGGRPVIHHDDIPAPASCFVIPCVSSIGAADHIRAFLETRGFVAGRSYIEAAL